MMLVLRVRSWAAVHRPKPTLAERYDIVVVPARNAAIQIRESGRSAGPLDLRLLSKSVHGSERRDVPGTDIAIFTRSRRRRPQAAYLARSYRASSRAVKESAWTMQTDDVVILFAWARRCAPLPPAEPYRLRPNSKRAGVDVQPSHAAGCGAI